MAEDLPPHDDPAWQIAMCKTLVHQRRIIATALGLPLVENPNLDILIELYLAQAEGRQVFVWSLCAAANAAYSTAHRKLKELATAGIILQRADSRDRRRVEIVLTEPGLAIMRDMVTQMINVRWPS